MVPGDLDEPQTFEVDGIVVGLQTCYDLRFPEVTRRLADAGADLVAVPAEWVRGPLKEHHWTTLLAARAIENTLYVAAADHPPPIGVGASAIDRPDGRDARRARRDDRAWRSPRSSSARIREVRERNPALRLRRYRVSPI